MTSDVPTLSRAIRHPGPVSEPRILSHGGKLSRGEIRLQEGAVLMEAIAAELEACGIASAALEFRGLVLSPMKFVMPTFSRSPEHVAYYSETYARDEPVRVERGTATYGEKEGKPFLHGHILWHDSDGHQCGGHVLPFDCRIGEDCTIAFTGCREITMSARFDPETNFTLFQPLPGDLSEGGEFISAHVRPNEDLVTAIESICMQHGISRGRICSLIGSTVGARFEDGTSIDMIPTEILGLRGAIEARGENAPRIDLEIALIDAAGGIHFGRPTRGENPVLICAEIFIERQDGPASGRLGMVQ